MCGRYTLHTSMHEIARRVGITHQVGDMVSRYNIAPTSAVPLVRLNADGAREIVSLWWGLVPAFARDPIGSRFMNARSETVATKPAFRNAFRHRRCLIPADGFYEWRKEGSRKQPYLLRLRSGEPFFMAGLWEEWKPAGKEPYPSCTILTTAANELVSTIHGRMPVILPESAWQLWLNERPASLEDLQSLLTPYQVGEMEAYPVSMRVNSAKEDGPECIQRTRVDSQQPK